MKSKRKKLANAFRGYFRFNKNFVKRTFLFATGAATLLVLALAALFLYLSKDLPKGDQITNRQVSESTKIYDRGGRVLLYEISAGQRRTVIPFAEIPQYIKDATLAVEDEKFYEEPAFDFKAIVRAFLVNLIHGRILQGGSTITQQLAKNAFLAPEQTITRKLKEFILAIKLSRSYSKDEVLALYLNEIPYGPTAYGIESASQTYFAKPARDLNLAESAILSALPRAPSYYSPWGIHIKELFTREQNILKKMKKIGMINDQELTDALNAKIEFAPQNEGIKAPHFVMAVEDYLVQKYGEDIVRSGGLKVTTTLDWDLERVAEKVISEGAAQNENLYRGKNAALLAEDPKTGQILAMVGSRNYFDVKNGGNFNVVTQGLRQPGSALKPFVYLKVFQKGYTPDTVVFDVPTNFDMSGNPDRAYLPENFDQKFRGPVRLKEALAQSINVPSVKVLYLAGPRDAISLAYSFGLKTLDDPGRYGLSVVLGGGAVKMIDLVEAYSVLSQEGKKRDQVVILEVRDKNGNILESYKDHYDEVATPQYPRLINDILSDADLRAPLFQASLPLTIFPDHDVALKTGTSNDYRDAWAIGYTPSLVVGVWAGNNDNSPMQKHGGSILAAVPIWNKFMIEALKKDPGETFARPEPVISEKPMLAGNSVVNNEVHSILYYVDRRNPSGPPPLNPADDPQFENWEKGVADWIKNNPVDLTKSVSEDFGFASSAAPGPAVSIISPPAGSFIKNQVAVSFKITSPENLSEIKIFWNGVIIEKFSGGLDKNYSSAWSFVPSNISLQNLLEVEATTASGVSRRDSVIVYE